MRTTATASSVLCLAACVPLAPRVYLPADLPTSSAWGRSCEPEYTATLLDRDRVVLRLVVDASTQPFRGSLLLDAPAGSMVALSEGRLTLQGPGFAEPLAVPLSGQACRGSDFALVGAGTQCRFGASFEVQQEFVVGVPSARVNGTLYQVAPVRFQLQRVPMVIGLCQ